MACFIWHYARPVTGVCGCGGGRSLSLSSSGVPQMSFIQMHTDVLMPCDQVAAGTDTANARARYHLSLRVSQLKEELLKSQRELRGHRLAAQKHASDIGATLGGFFAYTELLRPHWGHERVRVFCHWHAV
jgi:hypothetical protein